MSSDRYRSDSSGRDRAEGPREDDRYGYGRGRHERDRSGSRGPSADREGSYGSQWMGQSPAQPQGDGEPYERGQQEWEPSGGPARWSNEGASSPSSFSRGSRSFDGWDRGSQGRGSSGGGYGEYNYRDEDSPRGRSMRGGYARMGGSEAGSFGSGFGPGREFGAMQGGWRPGEQDRGYGASSQGYGFGSSSSAPSGLMRPGRFSGKGPKGYQRSDDRIREDVSDALERHGELDASEIEVQVTGGEVTLAGTVPDRASKRLAEDAIEHLSGVKEVHNRLRLGGNGSPEKSSKDQAGKPSGSSSRSA